MYRLFLIKCIKLNLNSNLLVASRAGFLVLRVEIKINPTRTRRHTAPPSELCPVGPKVVWVTFDSSLHPCFKLYNICGRIPKLDKMCHCVSDITTFVFYTG